jgi:polar amino acid transport system substrate-binding protein
MYPAIQAGQVDALLQDLPVNLEHTKTGKFEIVEQYDTDESYGLAIKKGNAKLVEDVNAQLAELKSSGEYKKLYDKYFTAS